MHVGLAMTLRVVQTPNIFKFGIKNGISAAKKMVLLKMIQLYRVKYTEWTYLFGSITGEKTKNENQAS